MFVGATRRDLSVELFRMTLPSPVFMAPIGVIGLCAQDGHGLAIGGTDGVVHVLRSILAEADLIMAVDGYPTLADLTPASLRRTFDHG
jgi:isopentenyl diphosphate isomerase/L-lactate dehydrogenase-like FMN-dependent dehydrogenase